MIPHGPARFDAASGLPYGGGGDIEALSAELAESRRQFISVLRSLSGLFYRCELRAPWRMSFVSEGLTQLTGYTSAELDRQQGWINLVSVEDRIPIETMVAEAVAQKRSFDLTYRITRKNGEIRWVSERGHAVFDEDGSPLFLEGVISDISGRKEADELQKTIVARWRRTLDAIPQMVWTMEGDGSDEFYNAQWTNFTGHKIGGAEGLSRTELIHPDDQARVVDLWTEKFRTGDPYECKYRLRHVDGGYRWVLSRGEPEKDLSGRTLRWYGTCTDVHDEVVGRQALQASEAIQRNMIEASPDAIALLDSDGRIKFLNSAGVAALDAADLSLVMGQSWAEAFLPASKSAAASALAKAAAGQTGRFTATQSLGETERWWDVVVAPMSDPSAAPDGFMAIARDITHQKTAEERIRWAADHDSLTQLPNRAYFQRALDHGLYAADPAQTRHAILMLDLDDFKRTNDALGHHAGDALLTQFAARLREVVRRDDIVARLGGDEFAVLLKGMGSQAEIDSIVEAILQRLAVPWEFDGKLIDIKASIGASIFPFHGDCGTELLKNADIALYAAKAAGRGVMRMFQPEMRADAQKRMEMLNLAREALRQDNVLAFYQPKVDLRTGALDGFEALMRWRHPGEDVQSPDRIAAAFQDGTLAVEISDRMMKAIIGDMRRWSDAGVPFGHVALNAAATEFKDGAFADKLLERLHRASIAPSKLQLEVTETVFLGRGAGQVEQMLRVLAAEGVMIALDDFGTGYASLSHLNHFPVDVIKIDRSFIDKLETSDHDAAIVRAVIKLGRSLGIKIVAEGIESEQQAQILRKFRCHSGQGFLFGKAVPSSNIPPLVGGWDHGKRPN